MTDGQVRNCILLKSFILRTIQQMSLRRQNHLDRWGMYPAWKIRNTYEMLAQKPECMILHRRSACIWDDNIKMKLKTTVRGYYDCSRAFYDKNKSRLRISRL
jgi:hypothetical protein